MSARPASAKVYSRPLIAALAALTLQCGGGDGGGVTPPTDPTIALETATATFSATAGAAAPAAQSIHITNTGGGTLDGLSTSVSYTAGPATGWLTASLDAPQAPSTLTLTVASGSLAAGTYTALVAVTSAAATNSPQTVTVNLTVAPASGGGALITFSSASQNFAAPQGGANPAAQTVNVTNGGAGTLDGLAATVSYTAGQPTGWLNAALSATAAPSTLTLTATTGSLTAGTYTASVAVASPAASNSPQNVAVTFTVAPAPTLVISDSSLTFTGTEGDTIDPTPQTVNVTSGTDATLNDLTATVVFTQLGGWLDVALSSTTTPSTLTVTPHLISVASRRKLTTGTYTANIQVASATASNSPQTVTVTIVVDPPTSRLLYGVNSSTDALSIYDASTGVGRIVGPLDPTGDKFTTPVAMALRQNDLALFVWNNDGDLLTVDKTTGQGTAVNTTPQGTLGGLAFSPSGTLYGVSDALYSIDPATGVKSFIGGLGSGIRPVGAADFGCDGVLYGVEINGDEGGLERLLSIDLTTGAATPIATLSQDIGVIGSIAFDSAGTLVGSGFAGPLGNNILFDLGLNGDVSKVRQISDSAGGAPQGMAFLRVCTF